MRAVRPVARPIARPRARLLVAGFAGAAVAATAAVSLASTSPSSVADTLFTRVNTHGSFLPMTGPQRTLIVGPHNRVYAMPKSVPPHPDPAFLQGVPGEKCTPDNPYERFYVSAAGRYGSACKRITFAFGPVNVRPGQNNALIRPTTIEQPRYDGYIVRFRPDLRRATDGSRPRTEQLHLHHGTWLNLGKEYGDGPFFASGEEKTIADFPPGYGMEVHASDVWGLLYMVHDAQVEPDTVWVTYQIDFVDKAAGDKLGIAPIKPLWLDVQRQPIYPGAPSTGSNPVFNVQRGFGHIDPMTHTRVCRWPDENCARFDVYGHKSPQQGVPESRLHTDIGGADYRVPADMAGTIIGLGGHMHPGGIRDEVSLVRHGVEKPIFYSDAVYWNHRNPSRSGALPTSWDMSMSVTGSPLGWKVKIKPGDIVRLNAVYDTQTADWYENMGIVVAYVAPKDPHGPPGIDVFSPGVRIHNGAPAQALRPKGPYVFNYRPPVCHPDLIGRDGHQDLCLHGQITHPAIPESGDTVPGCSDGSCPALPKKNGPFVTDIHSVGFTYGQADLGVVGATGIPRVHRGSTLRLWNVDTATAVWHTFTACAVPCTGPTGVNYPVADHGGGRNDLESMEIGYGLLIDPAKSQLGGSYSYDGQWAANGAYYSFTPTKDGTYTFFCRVHPSMRGVFRVVH